MSTGAFGEVRMCVHRETGAQRAVKVLRKSHMDEDEKKMLFNEISILRELVSLISLTMVGPPKHCQNVRVLRGREALLHSHRVRYSKVTILRICKGGELFDEIIAKGKFTEKDAAVLMKQVLGCVNYCHKNHIVHR